MVYLFIPLLFFFITSAGISQPYVLPQVETVKLKPYAHLKQPALTETSGIVKSRRFPEVFWAHNDSGDWQRIFAVSRLGYTIKPDWAEDYQGIRIPDAVAVDWEDIAIDNQGRLYIGDIGNNFSIRRDLAIYILNEPDPRNTVTTSVLKRILFYYPEQKEFPDSMNNFDAEAMFCRENTIYILTKHRGDTQTHLYSLENPDPVEENAARLLETIDIGGMVTGADISPDGNMLAVITTRAVWVFEFQPETGRFFGGNAWWLPIFAKQCEAICFDGKRLILANEQGELFELFLSRLLPLKKQESP
ncbi:MAG: hypothetical protein WAN36_04140 [Calditrichia bacterium]